MSSVLDNIIRHKLLEVQQRKAALPQTQLEAEGARWKPHRKSLRSSLGEANATGIIAEFKRRSPSKGWFQQPDFNAAPVGKAYQQGGASAISVLTDTEFFGGSLADLTEVKKAVEIPVLRKDFIIDAWQIAEASAYGADVILLIAACLSPEQVRILAAYARSLGLDVLLELHEESELGHICADTEIIGINNRNLKTFEVDIDRSLQMARKLPHHLIKVAESGITDVHTLLQFRGEGFSGFLIGEHFMKNTDPGLAFQQWVKNITEP